MSARERNKLVQELSRLRQPRDFLHLAESVRRKEDAQIEEIIRLLSAKCDE
jgi:hypothetical protein